MRASRGTNPNPNPNPNPKGHLHLQAAADGVEGVRDEAGNDRRRLGDGEFGDEADDALVLLPGVELLQRVEDAEVRATVGDDAQYGGANAGVHTVQTAGRVQI